MNPRLLQPLLLLFGLLQACASEASEVKRGTADFFTKLSQGYRLHVLAQLPTEVMWTPLEIEKFEDLNTMQWAESIARLAGYIMQHKGVMNGKLILLFEIQNGEIQSQPRLCQPVENLLKEQGIIHTWSRPASRVVRTTHRGNQKTLGTAFRVLQEFTEQEGLKPTGWGSIRVIRGPLDEPRLSDYRTEVQLYVQ